MTKNFHYVTRANYEAVLKQELEKNGIAVIEGGSKTGKSELVNAYCHAHTTDYQQRIIWLHANSQAQLLAGCNQVLEEMLAINAITIDMEGSNSPEVVLRRLRNRLQKSNDNWLIVVDDIALCDFDLYQELPGPKSKNGIKHHIILITTDRRWLSYKLPHPITIEAFSQVEINQMFAKQLMLMELPDEQREAIAILTRQLNHYLPALDLASQIYLRESKRELLFNINANQFMSNDSIMRDLALLQLSDNPQLKHALVIMSLFKYSIPLAWLERWNVSKQTVEKLAEFDIDIHLDADKSWVKLGESLQSALLAELTHAQATFDEFNKPCQDALDLMNTEFQWNRVDYHKQLSDRLKSSQLAQRAVALLEYTEVWNKLVIEKQNSQYPQQTLTALTTLSNSLARYYFKIELFANAKAYYEQAKATFEKLIGEQQQVELQDERQVTVFERLLRDAGFMPCLLYSQDILHNISATIVKQSWSTKQQKQEALKTASQLCQLSYNWQLFLINRLAESHLDEVIRQLGLSTTDAWTKEAVTCQLNHFAGFTQRILAQIYQKQGNTHAAQLIYQNLTNNKDYMDRVETICLAHRDLAAVMRRQSHYEGALEQINRGLSHLLKTDFPEQHKSGQKVQLLYERAKIYLKMKSADAAKQDLDELLTLSASSVYKAKTHYLLARLASEQGHKIDADCHISDALGIIEKHNPSKHSIYQNFKLALNFAPVDEKTLQYFAKLFIQQSLFTLKEKLSTLNINAARRNSAMGVLKGLGRMLPHKTDAHTTKSAEDAQVNIEIDVATVLQAASKAIRALTDLLIRQYAVQINQLTHKGFETLAEQAATAIANLITEDTLSRHAKDVVIPTDEQLLKAIIKNIGKETLETKNPAVNKKWNTKSFFNRSRFVVKAENQPSLFYIPSDERKKNKYGYSIISQPPMPEDNYKSYSSEAEVEEAIQNVNKGQCLMM